MTRLAALLACGVAMACGDSGNSALSRGRGGSGGASGEGGPVGGGGSPISNGGSAAGGARPIGCRSDKDCTPLGLLCDPVGFRCVACVKATDCATGETCRSGSCDARIPCTNSRQCVSAPAGRLICDPSIGDCVQCVTQLDCNHGQVCTANVCGGLAGGVGGAAGAGGFVATGGSIGSGGSFGGAGAGGFIDTGGSAGFGGFTVTGGAPGDGGFGGAGGVSASGGGGGMPAGAWALCTANTDCVDGRTCTYATQQAFGIGGRGACVKNCPTGSTTDCTDPPLPGAAATFCYGTLCGIPCGTGSTCPAGFTCNPTFGFCFPSQ